MDINFWRELVVSEADCNPLEAGAIPRRQCDRADHAQPCQTLHIFSLHEVSGIFRPLGVCFHWVFALSLFLDLSHCTAVAEEKTERALKTPAQRPAANMQRCYTPKGKMSCGRGNAEHLSADVFGASKGSMKINSMLLSKQGACLMKCCWSMSFSCEEAGVGLVNCVTRLSAPKGSKSPDAVPTTGHHCHAVSHQRGTSSWNGRHKSLLSGAN